MKNINVRMVLESLEDFPEFELPDGFEFRNYVPGDCDAWVEIYSAAEKLQKITPELFYKEFYGNDEELAKRMFFIYKGEKVVGTSTAWYDDEKNSEQGRVHWVAIHPDFQGQGLAKPLLSETLRRLRVLCHTSSYLRTSTGRTPAICLYLKYGFVPEPENEEQRKAWLEWGNENGFSWDFAGNDERSNNVEKQ
jgi:GNAT superfamily N-acetyltransferase